MEITHISEHHIYPMIKLMRDGDKFRNELGISINTNVINSLDLAHITLHIKSMDIFDYFVMNKISRVSNISYSINPNKTIDGICNDNNIQSIINSILSRTNETFAFNYSFIGDIKLPMSVLLNIASNKPEVIFNNVLDKDNLIDMNILTENVLNLFVPYYLSFFDKIMNNESSIVSSTLDTFCTSLSDTNPVSLISVHSTDYSVMFAGIPDKLFNTQISDMVKLTKGDYNLRFAIRCDIKYIHYFIKYIIAWSNLKIGPSNTKWSNETSINELYKTLENILGDNKYKAEYSLLKYHVLPDSYKMNIVIEIPSLDVLDITNNINIPENITSTIFKYYKMVDSYE